MSFNVQNVRTFTTQEGANEVALDLNIEKEIHHIYFRSENITLFDCPEAEVALSLLWHLKFGIDLSVDRCVSKRFLDSMERVMDIYNTWDRSLNRIRINTKETCIKENIGSGRVGLFFSTGIDSLFTLLKNLDEINDLIFIHGFDLRLDEIELRNKTSDIIENIGKEFKKNVIHIETNFRERLGDHFSWAKIMHGVTLATVGHLISRHYKKIYISANHTYANLHPAGAHPILDPLWSTESTEFVHYGCQADRIEKAALIAQYPTALNSIRVCWKKTGGAYNCGECNKCVNAMTNLYLAGALDHCSTFSNKINYRKMKMALNFLTEGGKAFVMQNISYIERNNGDKKLLKALKKIHDRPLWKCYFIAAIKKTNMIYETMLKRKNIDLR
ncbi:MAG: hypothetical protein AB1641_22870 [Thermodesulfobacteriota bacterium]